MIAKSKRVANVGRDKCCGNMCRVTSVAVTKVIKPETVNVLNLKWLLNSAVGLDLPSPLAMLALKVLLNASQEVKCLKEIGHLTKSISHLTRYPSWSS